MKRDTTIPIIITYVEIIEVGEVITITMKSASVVVLISTTSGGGVGIVQLPTSDMVGLTQTLLGAMYQIVKQCVVWPVS